MKRIYILTTLLFSLIFVLKPGNSNAQSEELIHFFFFQDLPNNTPLETIDAVFSENSTGEIEFQSALEGYPFDSSHPDWRRASMERRGEATSLNYRPEGNNDIEYGDAGNIRAMQVKQPFTDNGRENKLILNMSTEGYENILLTFAAMDEDAGGQNLLIDYSVNSGEPDWVTTGLGASETTQQLQTDVYQLYTVDFTGIESAENNPDFKVRIRFDVTDGTADSGDRITFNNIALEGDPFSGITAFYYSGSGDVANESSWGRNTDGSGSQPDDFVSDNQIFIVGNTPSVTLSSPWTVSGIASSVTVDDGTTFILDASLTGSVNVNNNGTLRLQVSDIPDMGNLEENSTVEFTGAAVEIPYATFGNLVFNNISPVFSGTGDLVINGDMTLNGSVTMPQSRGFDEYDVFFTGSGDQTLSGNGNLFRSYEFNVVKSSGIFQLNDSNGGTDFSSDSQLNLNVTGTAEFRDNGQTIYAGNSVNIEGEGDNYSFTGTLILADQIENVVNGAGDDNNFNIRGSGNSEAAVARLGNVIVQAPNDDGGEYRFRQGVRIGGDLTVESGVIADLRFYDGVVEIGGNLTVEEGFSGSFTEVENDFIFNGTGDQVIRLEEEIEFFNVVVEKSTGTFSVHEESLPLRMLNNFEVYASGSGVRFEDNGNTIIYGDELIHEGSAENYNLTGTLILEASGGSNDFEKVAGELNHLIIRTSGNARPRFRDSSDFDQEIVIKGDLVLEMTSERDLFMNDVTLFIGGDFVNTSTSDTDTGTSTLVFNGTGEQGFESQSNPGYYNVIVEKSSGTFTIEEDSEITVTNLLTFESGTVVNDGELILASDAYYLNNSASNPEITFERLLSDHSRWVGISSPVAGAIAGNGGLLQPLWTQGFPGSDQAGASNANVLIFDETETDPDSRYKAPEANVFTPGKGMIVYVYERKDRDDPDTAIDFDIPFSITGSQNTFTAGSYDFDLTFTPDGGEGWNLLGNPFSVPLDWASSGWTKTDINSFAYVWNPEENQFDATGDDSDAETGLLGSTTIAPFQAFFVRTESGSAELIAGEDVRTTESTVHLNNTEEIYSMMLNLSANGKESRTILRFAESYSDQHDRNNAYYLTPLSSSYTSLYTIAESNPLLINSLPLTFSEELRVPLNAETVENGIFTEGEAEISLLSGTNLPEGWEVVLKDIVTGGKINLTDHAGYSFMLEPEKGARAVESFKKQTPVAKASPENVRFELIFRQETASGSEAPSELPEQLALDQNYPNPFNPSTVIRYHLPESAETTLDVYNTTGQRVARLVQATQPAGTHTVTFNADRLASGVYLYRLQSGGKILTRKMVLVK